MPITIRDARHSNGDSKQSNTPRKRNVASLVGGVVIAVGCLVLWVLVATQLTRWPPSLPLVACGVVLAMAIGGWIRLADL